MQVPRSVVVPGEYGNGSGATQERVGVLAGSVHVAGVDVFENFPQVCGVGSELIGFFGGDGTLPTGGTDSQRVLGRGRSILFFRRPGSAACPARREGIYKFHCGVHHIAGVTVEFQLTSYSVDSSVVTGN